MEKEKMYKILDICSSLEDVKKDVIKNHDNNMWWPLDIEDDRKRLLIAGLSTRISYNMIGTYVKVIEMLDSFSYEEISSMTDIEIIEIIKPLGLSNTRLKYVRSMIDFINRNQNDINNMDKDTLIDLIAKNVNGASYKVAQCCVLYINDYHCQIMPVDSGMKDMTLPCFGFKEQKAGIGHEYARKDLESSIEGLDLGELIKKNGYEESITLPKEEPYTWWAHLVLIYYKRHYCNKHKPNDCPIKQQVKILERCKK